MGITKTDSLTTIDHGPLGDIDWTGASVLPTNKLTMRQDRVLRDILLRVYEIADGEAQLGVVARTTHEYVDNQQFRRPRHVFFIDGARGSGKTSMLLTIREFLKCLGDADKWADGRWNFVTNYLKGLRTYFSEEVEKKRKDLNAAKEANPESKSEKTRFDSWPYEDTKGLVERLFREPHRGHEPRVEKRHTACVLPLLVPSDLEQTQSVMEALFALMITKLKGEIMRCKSASHTDSERVTQGEALVQKLHDQVAKGWYLAKSERDEAIRAYSYNLENYLTKLGSTGAESYNRVAMWRSYVNEYLDYFKAQLLVTFVDDTDVSPQTTADILHTIRIFLDHPRIVTIVAGHLRSMRQSLTWRQLSDLKDPVEVSADPTGGTPTTWRRLVRHQIEEYLEKILPRPLRFFLSFEPVDELADFSEIGDPSNGQKGDKDKEWARDKEFFNDFETLVGGLSFDQYCRQRLSDFRDDFLRIKVAAFQNRRLRLRELASEDDKNKLESFLAWWLFRHRYGEQLRPRSIRQLRALVGLTGSTPNSVLVSRHLPHRRPKRLAVILFEAPENNLLIDRFSDADTNVGAWLQQQSVDSCWRGERYFRIGDRTLQRGTYGYSFIGFRLDLGLALPLREDPDANVPIGLLPRPSGQNMIGMTPFFPKMQPQTLFGVAKQIQHSVLPANCIYFHDLDCLPDIAFEPGLRIESQGEPLRFSKDWDTNLIYRWPELFFFDVDRLWTQPMAGIGEATTAAKKEGRAATAHEAQADLIEKGKVEVKPGPSEELLATYLKEVVLPLGSLEIGRFTPPATKVENGELLADIETRREFAEKCAEIDSLRRHYDYYNHFAETALGRTAASSLAKTTVEGWNKFVTKALHLKEPVSGAQREIDDVLADSFESYQALINDMRRAWHASRILLNQLPPKRVDQDREAAGEKWPFERTATFWEGNRYTIPSFNAVRHWIQQNGYSREAFERLTADPLPGKLEEVVRELISNPTEVQPGDVWKKVPLRLFVADAAGLGPDVNGAWPEDDSVFDAAFPSSVKGCQSLAKTPTKWALLQIDPSRHQDVDLARYSKSLFLYLWALMPCLPALVHIEYGAVCHKARRIAIEKRELTNVVDNWQEFVRWISRYYLRYRASLELTLIRLEITQVTREPREEPRPSLLHGVSFSMIPDISFTSMGVEGAQGFLARLGEPAPPGWGKMFKDRVSKLDSREGAGRELKSVFADFEEKLIRTAEFLSLLKGKAGAHHKRLASQRSAGKTTK